jgi:hypothetical protein
MSRPRFGGTDLRVRTRYLLSRLLVVIEALLVIRFLLHFFQASAQAGFVSLMNGITNPLVLPFQGIFKPALIRLGDQGPFVVEFESLVALIVYAILGRLIISLIR